MKRVLGLAFAFLTAVGSLAVVSPAAATRTAGTVQRVSATRIRVKGHTDSWSSARGWTPLASNTYRTTVQKQQADGTWANVNGVAPDQWWNITGTAGSYRLAYRPTCARPYAASSGRAVRISAPATKPRSSTGAPSKRCDPNYAGACVPIASDVDCAGGSGNGPAYVQGPVTVIGSDVYGLDGDGDGVGCE